MNVAEFNRENIASNQDKKNLEIESELLSGKSHNVSNPIIVFDVSHYKAGEADFDKYDRMLALVVLQGLVNRSHPRLFLSFFSNRVGSQGDPEGGSIINYDLLWLERICGNLSFQDSTCRSKYTTMDGRKVVFLNAKSTSLKTLLSTYFLSLIKGFIVWDKRVRATSNAAITLSGLYDALPIRSQSVLAQDLLTLNLPIIENLYTRNFTNTQVIPELSGHISTGSSKANVYYWLLHKYGDQDIFSNTPKYNGDYVGNYLDSFAADFPKRSFYTNNLSHLDLIVKKKGVVFDLSPMTSFLICDATVGAPYNSDALMIHRILNKSNIRNSKIKYFYGRTPWNYKYSSYSNCKQGEDSSMPPSWHLEHEMVNLYSQYNFVSVATDAESGCCDKFIGTYANASFYEHLKSQNTFRNLALPPNFSENNIVKNSKSLTDKIKHHILFVLSDYDSPAWTWYMLTNKGIWGDPNRGNIPLAWGINSSIFDQQPYLADYILQTRSNKDFIVTQQGLGYFNVDNITNKADLIAQSRNSMTRYNLNHLATYFITNSITGEVGITPTGLNTLKAIAPLGVGKSDSNDASQNDVFIVGETPFVTMPFYIHYSQTVPDMKNWFFKSISSLTHYPDGPNLILVRAVNVSPTKLINLVTELNKNDKNYEYQAVDPISFFKMAHTPTVCRPSDLNQGKPYSCNLKYNYVCRHQTSLCTIDAYARLKLNNKVREIFIAKGRYFEFSDGQIMRDMSLSESPLVQGCGTCNFTTIDSLTYVESNRWLSLTGDGRYFNYAVSDNFGFLQLSITSSVDSLNKVQRYAKGPCHANYTKGDVCKFESRSVVDLVIEGKNSKVESINAYGRYWNFNNTAGGQYLGEEINGVYIGKETNAVDRYKIGPCRRSLVDGLCKFFARESQIHTGNNKHETVFVPGYYYNYINGNISNQDF
ncbi:MAG: hypothetical protein KBD78_11885 [Oligoflexales bacterium]|nr:hypothetical protein [Oligoflexales bacterium]